MTKASRRRAPSKRRKTFEQAKYGNKQGAGYHRSDLPRCVEEAITNHACIRYCQRAFGWDPHQFGNPEDRGKNLKLLEDMLAHYCPGMSVEALREKILSTPGLKEGWEMGCLKVKADGLQFVIASRRIVTVIAT
jgi:hypothetical protein